MASRFGSGSSSLHDAADRATDSNAFEYTARVGFAASGVLHLLLGYIVLRIALGTGGGNADKSGALAALASQTGGKLVLWAAAVGLVGLGLWRVAEALLGSKPGENSGGDDNPMWKRAKSLGVAIASFSIAVSCARFAMGGGQSDSQQNSGMSAQLMQSGWGKFVLIVVGIVVLAIGGTTSTRASPRSSSTNCRSRGAPPSSRPAWLDTSRRVWFWAAPALLVIVATLQADPAKASGIDAAVKTLGQAPFGKFLLILAALGLAAFGAYSFVPESLQPDVTVGGHRGRYR